MVQENLRQICIWEVLSNTHKNEEKMKWWGYVRDYALQCFDHTKGACANDKAGSVMELEECGKQLTKCSYDQMKAHGIDASAVDKCIRASAIPALKDGEDVSKATDDDHDNAKLKAELDERLKFNLLALPAITLNENVLKSGTIDSETVLSSICSMLSKDKQPEKCTYAIMPKRRDDAARNTGRFGVSFSFMVDGID